MEFLFDGIITIVCNLAEHVVKSNQNEVRKKLVPVLFKQFIPRNMPAKYYQLRNCLSQYWKLRVFPIIICCIGTGLKSINSFRRYCVSLWKK